MLVADSAPGAGKTTIIMAICLGVLRSSSPCRVLIAQPNKALCKELVDRLRRTAEQSQLPPAISRVGWNDQARCDAPTDHLEEYVSSKVKETLHLEETVLRALDHTLEILKKANYDLNYLIDLECMLKSVLLKILFYV